VNDVNFPFQQRNAFSVVNIFPVSGVPPPRNIQSVAVSSVMEAPSPKRRKQAVSIETSDDVALSGLFQNNVTVLLPERKDLPCAWDGCVIRI
jgi:hypothetical protein